MSHLSVAPSLVQRVLMLHLHPQQDMHPSWLPASWPLRWRRWQQLGPGGQATLARWLRSRLPEPDYRFDTPRRRLLLMDSASLRRLAIYLGLVLHAPLMTARDPLGAQLRRQARRIDADAPRVVCERLPMPASLRADAQRLQQQPLSAGRVMVDRGYRLLQAAMAAEGPAALQRLQHKLPRRAAGLRPLALLPHQADQLDELMLMCIVPERLPQWDWLT